MAMFFVVLFSVLAISFASMSNMNVQMSRNHRDMSQAQAAAESGLEYTHYLVYDYLNTDAMKTVNNTVNDEDASDAFYVFTDYLQTQLAGLAGQAIPDPIAFNEDGQTGLIFVVPVINFSDGRAGFILTVKQYDDDPQNLDIISTGVMADITRSISISYSMSKDTTMLQFAVASRSRVIITGDSTVELGIFSDWTDTDIAPPIELSAASTVNGDISTTMSEGEFPIDNINGTYDEINYDQPEVDLPTADDFDTSMYTDGTSNLPNTGQRQTEYFPHGETFTDPVAGSTEIRRTVYGPANPEDPPLVLTDKMLAAGGNALFRNCIFEGILYIGNGGGLGTNNIRFENCTFNGRIVTGVPPLFGPETWKKNVLYFTGDSVFDNQMTYDDGSENNEAVILAPNYNVNIGNTTALEDGSVSVIKGIILGGVVDIRGNVQVDGTIVSMHAPSADDWGGGTSQVATNIGFSDENAEAGGDPDGVITISPSPDRMLPIGISTKILMSRDGASYNELGG